AKKSVRPFGAISQERRSTRRFALWSIPSPFCFSLQHLQAIHPLLFSITHLIFSFGAWHTGTLGEFMDIRRLAQWVRRSSLLILFIFLAAFPNRGLINTPNLNFCLSSSKTQVQQLKKDVSNSTTQDSIINEHKKTQFTHARINCTLKDSSCDSPLPKILKLTILASNASSSSTKVVKPSHKG
ncbi:hypothetical protein H5410_062394, partial [Solanum commersonii]